MSQDDTIKHIVLADDDKDHGVIFRTILGSIAPGLNFTQVYDGAALLKFLYMHKVDLVFLDLHMPCKNGHECLDEIKTNPALREIPVLVYSSSCQMADIQKSFLHQADVYMVKPFSSEHLKKALQSVLSVNWKGDLPIRKHYFINNRFVPYTATG
jgi:CheY-like chemotaxis protein